MDTQQVKILASSPTDSGYGTCTTLAALADLAGNVRDVEADVKDAIQLLSNKTSMDTLNLHNRLCESEKAAIEAKFEGRLETKDAVEKINTNTNHAVEELSEEVSEFKEEVMEKFCEIEKARLQDEIDELRQAKADGVDNGIISTLNAILAKIK